PARLTGTDERGRPVRVEVQSGIDLALLEGNVTLPLARQARIVVEGEDGFELETGELRDLDWATRRVNASGGIVYRAGGLVAVAREARTLEPLPGAGPEATELELL